MPTSVEEYRKARVREIELPSVLEDGKTHPVFKIRKPNATVLIEFSSALGLEISEDIERIKESYKASLKTPEGQQKVSDGLRKLLVNCVVEPQLSLVEEKDKLFVDDVDVDDQLRLLDAILETTKLSEEAKRQRESFRESTSS